MQTGHAVLDKTWVAEAAITLYQCVKLGTNANQVNVCGAGEAGVGFAQQAQATVAAELNIRHAGISKAVAAVTVTKGGFLKGAAAGKVTPVTAAGDRIVAMALSTANTGLICDVLVMQGVYCT